MGFALSSTTWTPIGPAPVLSGSGRNLMSGRINVAAADPSNPAKLYVGGDGGGIWTTTLPVGGSGFIEWTPRTDDKPSLDFDAFSYHTLAVHPADPRLVLGAVSGPGAGVLRYVAALNGWEHLPSPIDGKTITAIALDPHDATVFYIAIDGGGIFRWSDHGQRFSALPRLPHGPGARVRDLIVANDAADGRALYAAVAGTTQSGETPNGVYKSIAGTSWRDVTGWQPLTNGLPPPAAFGPFTGIRLEPASTPGTVYAACVVNRPELPCVWLLNQQLHFTYATADTGLIWDAGYDQANPNGRQTLQQINGPGGLLPTAPLAAGQPCAYVLDPAAHVVYRDGAGWIWSVYYDGTGWYKLPITGPGTAVLGHPPSADSDPFVWLDGGRPHYTYRHDPGEIWDVWFDGLQWQANTIFTRNTPPAGRPAAWSDGSYAHYTYRTTDGIIYDEYNDGTRWRREQINGPAPLHGHSLNPSSTNAGDPFALTAGSYGHVFYRDDTGIIWDARYDIAAGSWTVLPINQGAPAEAGSDPFACAAGNELHVAYRGSGGYVYHAKDDGTGWHAEQITGPGSPAGGSGAAGLGPCVVSSGQDLHFVYNDFRTGAGGSICDAWFDASANQWYLNAIQSAVQRFKTADGGRSWSPLATSLMSSVVEPRNLHLALAVDPHDDRHVLANDAYAILESRTGGDRWTQADAGVYDYGRNPFDWVNLAFDGHGHVLATADQGVLRYIPATGEWSDLVGNLQVGQFKTIALDPNDPDVVYGVGQDISSVRCRGSLAWHGVSGVGEFGKIVVDPRGPGQIYGYNPGDTGNLVVRSIDGGNTPTTVFAPGAAAGISSSNSTFALDWNDPTRLIAAAAQLYEITAADTSAPRHVRISDFTGLPITAVALAPSDSQTIYAATNDGQVWVTNNSGAHGTGWRTVNSGRSGGAVVDIRVDPHDRDHAFAVDGASIWELDPGLAQWRNISGDFQTALGANTIFVEWRHASAILYVGSNRGVFWSTDNGATWKPFGSGFPRTVVTDLQGVRMGNRTILGAGTYGRGVWEIAIVSAVKVSGVVYVADDSKIATTLGGVPVSLVASDGFTYETVSDRSGAFSIPSVEPGTYAVRHTPPTGFTPLLPDQAITVSSADLEVFIPDVPKKGGPYWPPGTPPHI